MLTRILAVATVMLIAAAASAETPSVSGRLAIGGKTYRFAHVYAERIDDVEGNRLSGPEKSIVLLFSDRALQPDEIDDWFHLGDLARSGKLHAVELRYDPAAKALFGATIFCSLKPQDPPPNITLSGNDVNHGIDDLALTDTTISGTARMAKPEEWVQISANRPHVTFTYHAEFHAPLIDEPPITEDLTGDAAKASAEVVLAHAFFAALRAGDIAMVRQVTAPNPALDAAIHKDGAAQVSAFLQQSGPDPDEFVKSVRRVVARGDRCSILAGTGVGNDDFRLHLVRKDGTWLVAQ